MDSREICILTFLPVFLHALFVSSPPSAEAAAAAAAPPEPEEPFDNTKYQNLQHHTYNPYTFADLDVEMAKFRLPQPSADRR